MNRNRELIARSNSIIKDLSNIGSSVKAMVTTIKLLLLELWIINCELYLLFKNLFLFTLELLKLNNGDDQLTRFLKSVPGSIIKITWNRYIFNTAYLILFYNFREFYQYPRNVLLIDVIYILNISIAYGYGIHLSNPKPKLMSIFFLMISIAHIIAFIVSVNMKSPTFLITVITNLPAIEVLIISFLYLIEWRLQSNHSISEVERSRLIFCLKRIFIAAVNYFYLFQYITYIRTSKFLFVMSFVIAYKFIYFVNQLKIIRADMNAVRKYTTKLSNIELNDESSKCAICLEDNDITSRKLSCNHKFHLNCLAALVKSNQSQDFHELTPSYLCPMCKEKWNCHKLKNQKQESKIDDDYNEESKDIRY